MSLVPALDPPNSLDPGPKGKVRFEHDHQRAIACTAQREGKQSSCRADRQPADSATQLVLRPLPPARITVKDRRQNVELVFSSQVGRQDRTLELGAGDWEVDWPGYDKRPHFRVRPGDEFDIPLRTLSGSCKRARDECVLETATIARECSVPDGQRVKP